MVATLLLYLSTYVHSVLITAVCFYSHDSSSSLTLPGQDIILLFFPYIIVSPPFIMTYTIVIRALVSCRTHVKKLSGFLFFYFISGGGGRKGGGGFWRRAREWWRRIVFDSPSALCFLGIFLFFSFFFVLSCWTMMACVCIILLLYSLYLPWPFRVWKKKEARAISIVPRVPTRANPIQSSRQLPPMHHHHHHHQQ